jgi:hypothetical protein
MKNIGYVLCFFLLFIVSCTTTYNVRNLDQDKNGIPLDSKKAIYLALPRDGRYQGTFYRGSGQTYQELLEINLEEYSSKIILGEEYKPIEECAIIAKENNADYLFFSTIINWEDRATAWSGIADTLTIKIEILDLETDKTIYTAELFGKGKNVTFSTGSPADLLPGLFQELINSIYK